MRSFAWRFSLRSLALFGVLFNHSALAVTRAPSTTAEKSLLYWRYLCRLQPQTDSVRNGVREFSCLSQGWKVRASDHDGRIKEVIEDDTH